MKKFTALILVVLLLAACQPTPTPTPEPVEALATSASDLVGTWWSSQAGAKIEIKSDGTFRVFAKDETYDQGTYTFEAGKITWTTVGHGSCENQPSTYETYVTTEAGERTWLRLQLVGTASCASSEKVAENPLQFLNP